MKISIILKEKGLMGLQSPKRLILKFILNAETTKRCKFFLNVWDVDIIYIYKIKNMLTYAGLAIKLKVSNESNN